VKFKIGVKFLNIFSPKSFSQRKHTGSNKIGNAIG